MVELSARNVVAIGFVNRRSQVQVLSSALTASALTRDPFQTPLGPEEPPRHPPGMVRSGCIGLMSSWLLACSPVDGRVELGGDVLRVRDCDFEVRGGRALVDFELERGDRLRLVAVDARRFLVLFVDERGRIQEEYGDCAFGFVDERRANEERRTVDVEVDFDCRSRIPELRGQWRARSCDA